MATRSKLRFFLFGIGVSIATALLLLMSAALRWQSRASYSCLRLRDGNVQVSVDYPLRYEPKDWIFESGGIELFAQAAEGRAFLNGEEGGGSRLILSIYSNYYQPLTLLLNTDRREPGPVYEMVTFNGHEAAFFQNQDGEKFYRIPVGNRVVAADYFPSRLTESERQEAERMLQGVAITQVPEDYQGRTVRPCDQ